VKMVVQFAVRNKTPLFAAILLFALGSRPVDAQSFNAYDVNQIQLLSGYTFSVNGSGDLSNVGQSGTYEFGFSGSGTTPITAVVVSSGSIFGSVGTIIQISAVDQFGLISGAGVSFTTTGNVIHDYDGSTNTPWNPDTFGGGIGYTSANFGNADFLKGLGEFTSPTDAKYGTFNFAGVSSSGQIVIGTHVRVGGGGPNPVTAPVEIVGLANGPIVPEGSSMAMLGMGMLPILGICIRRRKNASHK